MAVVTIDVGQFCKQRCMFLGNYSIEKGICANSFVSKASGCIDITCRRSMPTIVDGECAMPVPYKFYV